MRACGHALKLYSTQGVADKAPRALSATRPLLSHCEPRSALPAHINYNLYQQTLFQHYVINTQVVKSEL